MKGKAKTPTHDVCGDMVLILDFKRLTCYGPDCNEATLLHERWMRPSVWRSAKAEFLRKHKTREKDIRPWSRPSNWRSKAAK